MVLILVGLVAGGAAGYLAQRRARRRRAEESGDETDSERAAFVREVVTVGRRAALTGLVFLRVRLWRAYKLTAKQYAPVPLTYTKALVSSFLPIYSTMCGANLSVWSGARLFQAVFLPNTGPALGPGRALGLMACVTSGYWVYGISLHLWERGPMRGGLNVFGASPSLDRCASSERYIAEKLVSFGNLGLGGARNLRDLARFTLPMDVDASLKPVATSLRTYAKTAQARVPLLPEIGSTWGDFAKRQSENEGEFKELAAQIKYPSAVRPLAEPVLNTTSELRTFGTRIADIGERWADLKKELGHQGGKAKILMLTTGMLGGLLVGMEVADKLED